MNALPLLESYFVVSVVPVPCVLLVTAITALFVLLALTTPLVLAACSAHT